MDSWGGEERAKDFWEAVNILYFVLSGGYKGVHFIILCKFVHLCFMYFLVCSIFHTRKVLKMKRKVNKIEHRGYLGQRRTELSADWELSRNLQCSISEVGWWVQYCFFSYDTLIVNVLLILYIQNIKYKQ